MSNFEDVVPEEKNSPYSCCDPMPEEGVKIDFVASTDGDWMGMYVRGLLVTEGHGIHVTDAFHLVRGEKIGIINTWDVPSEWLNDVGRLPHSLDECPIIK